MNTLSMARKKKELTPNQQLARAILDQYQPKNVEDMQNALKDIFGPMFEAMLQGEMNSHLGYSSNERGDKETVSYTHLDVYKRQLCICRQVYHRSNLAEADVS